MTPEPVRRFGVKLSAFALAICVSGCIVREKDPEKAFDKRDYRTAADLWLGRVERGDHSALCPLAVVLKIIPHRQLDVFSLRLEKLSQQPGLQGSTAENSLTLACYTAYLRRAADGGNPKAQYELATTMGRDEPEGRRFLELAARNGSAEAQFDIGRQHFLGSDLSTTVYWWKLSSAQGYGEAQYALALLYRDGNGVPQDLSTAAKLFAQDAQQGSFEAQLEIGKMYEKGQGVPQDFVQAHFWFNVAGAAAFDDDDRKRASEARDRVGLQMTKEQIAAAQRLARDWKPFPERR